MKRSRLLHTGVLFLSGMAFILLCTLSIAPGYSQLRIILFLALILAATLWRLRPCLRWETGDALYAVCAVLLSMLVSMYFREEYAPVWLTGSSALGRAAGLLGTEPFTLLTICRWLAVLAAIPFITASFKFLNSGGDARLLSICGVF